MANYGIKASKPNKNVLSEDDRDLSFTSKYNLLKIFAQGRYTTTTVSGTIRIKHGLGYVPAFIVTAAGATGQDANDRVLAQYRSQTAEAILASANKEDLIIVIDTAGTETNIFYYIFIDPGT